jgi:hypothetical protein
VEFEKKSPDATPGVRQLIKILKDMKLAKK